MRKYVYTLEIKEGKDEFWEDIRNKNMTGCEELSNLLEELLYEGGFITNGEYKNCSLVLNQYSNKN
jgi:hypothetical protein